MDQTHPFSRSLSPIKLADLELKNRIIMGSMHTGLEDKKSDLQDLIAYYLERVRGGVSMIVTGGVSPNNSGKLYPLGSKLNTKSEVKHHRQITDAVHQEEGKICLQLLHSGRYGFHPFITAPSMIKSPITPFFPLLPLLSIGVRGMVNDFVKSGELARDAGYDAIEIMGSEGYFINQFLSKRTNKRSDEWGKEEQDRLRFPLEIISKLRKALGKEFPIIYRISLLDLVPEGQIWSDVITLARELEKVGVSALSSGIGWHESRIPTIAAIVPRGAFTFAVKKLKSEVTIPVIASNRINNPEHIESLLANGLCDIVSMARPFLADPNFVKKMEQKAPQEINTCVACNQACLDHIFEGKKASCLVNPVACNELSYSHLSLLPLQGEDQGGVKKRDEDAILQNSFYINGSKKPQNLVVIGAGPAGLSFALEAAKLGHQVTLYESLSELGGQLLLAKKIPGKIEFNETIRYYHVMLKKLGATIHTNTFLRVSDILALKCDRVILATGVRPRVPSIEGIYDSKVIPYNTLLTEDRTFKEGSRFAIIGGGGIGIDCAIYLLGKIGMIKEGLENFFSLWGVDPEVSTPGGLISKTKENIENSPVGTNSNNGQKHQIYILKRSVGAFGKELGKTTSWIHRRLLKMGLVKCYDGIQYQHIDEKGIVIKKKGERIRIEVDYIINCSGQLPLIDLYHPLINRGVKVHLIGGANTTENIDAKMAIISGHKLAHDLDKLE